VLHDLVQGESFVVKGSILIELVGDQPGTSSTPVLLGSGFLTGAGPHTLTDVGGPITVQIWSRQQNAMLCGLPGT
jgi:hypothetical protein